MKSNWSRFSVDPNESNQDYQTNDPLPDFVPPTLFSDLLLPEVIITTPPQLRNSQPDVNLMPIVQAMKTFTPGRASRRFGVTHIRATHWIAPPNWEEREQNLLVEDYCTEFEEAGIFQLWHNREIVDIRCIRPWAINPTQVPASVSIRSNAQLEWYSQIIPPGDGIKLELPQGSPWCKIITEICCFTHTQQSPIETRRFAIASHANILFKKGEELDTIIHFTQQNGNPAAVGFTIEVDGLVFRLQLPSSFEVKSSDTTYFQYRVLTDATLCGLTNSFQREWLYQIYISMLAARALADEISLPEAFNLLADENIGSEMAKVLDNIFQTLNVEETLLEEGEEPSAQNIVRQKIHDKLRRLCNLDTIQTRLNDLAKVLWSEPDAGWHAWTALRFKATVGAALLDACGQLCPHFDLGELILDIEPGPRPVDAPAIPEGCEEIWITESSIGGGGVIEEILRRYAADPANFFRLAQSALEPSDFEIVDSELTRLLELTQTSTDVIDAIADVRLAQGYSELKQASTQLRKVLSSQGILVTHPVMTAINTRILRPGSTPETDKLLFDLICSWHEQEERLGIEIDARVFAYVASNDDNLDKALLHLGLVQPNPYWRFQVIYGLLWARGNIIRSRALSIYNPFASFPDTDRETLLSVLQAGDTIVYLDKPDWREQVEEAFKQGASVLLIGNADRKEDLKSAILDLVVKPMELGFLQVYPLVEGVQQHPQGFAVRLRVQEAVQ